MLAVLGAGIWEISQQRLTAGGLLSLAGYLGYLYPPLQQLGHLALSTNAATASADRIAELLDERPDVVDSPRARPIGRAMGHLAFHRVTHAYPGGAGPALRELSFRVEPGQFMLVTGASGAGKSTLTRLLLRFADPTAGRILLDGVDLRAITLASLRDNITLVPQAAVLRTGTVRDNIAYGCPQARMRRSTPRPLPPTRTSSSVGCRLVIAPSWSAAANGSPVGNGNGWRWPGRWSGTPRCWCWTNRPPTSTRARRSGCCNRCGSSRALAPSS
jgi:hypothetical protein